MFQRRQQQVETGLVVSRPEINVGDAQFLGDRLRLDKVDQPVGFLTKGGRVLEGALFF